MKKIKMIVPSIIILVIIGSALSFKAKIHSFCILDNSTSGTNCTTYSLNKQVTFTGPQYKYVPCNTNWNKITCTAANNGLCTAGPIQLEGN